MKPIFSREALVDRRHPQIRWNAIIAGSILALGLWTLFGLLFIGGALTEVDHDELQRVGTFGIGTGIGTVLAPLFAMFAGGLVAGRIVSAYDRRVSAAHGALVWAITSIFGLVIMASVIGGLADRREMRVHRGMATPPPGTAAYIEDQVRLINQHLKARNSPAITTNNFLDAARYAGSGPTISRDAFVSRLDANTKLSRAEAEVVVETLGDAAPDAIIAGQHLALHRQQAMKAAEHTGNALLGAGVGLFLCLATTIAGSIYGARLLMRNRNFDRPDTIPGAVPHTTAPYPTTVPPADPDDRRDLE